MKSRLIGTGLVLIFYPFVFVASSMSLATKGDISLLYILMKLFLYGVILYPVVYIIALTFILLPYLNKSQKHIVSFIPLRYLQVCAFLFVVLFLFDLYYS